MNVIIPRAARIPSDINVLLSTTAEDLSMRTFGTARYNDIRAEYIGSLIADSLKGK